VHVRYDITPRRMASSWLAHTSGAIASRSTHHMVAAI
jgi:hypothetical protein